MPFFLDISFLIFSSSINMIWIIVSWIASTETGSTFKCLWKVVLWNFKNGITSRNPCSMNASKTFPWVLVSCPGWKWESSWPRHLSALTISSGLLEMTYWIPMLCFWQQQRLLCHTFYHYLHWWFMDNRQHIWCWDYHQGWNRPTNIQDTMLGTCLCQ